MTASGSPSPYALGSTDWEHERLIRQAALLAPSTEQFLREAGISPGQRVLDLGSGVGDVAMLAARLVGPSGEVVGVERDAQAIARARVRVAEANLHNVSFTQSDAGEVSSNRPFDAAVGRFILQFLPDPVAILRYLSRLVRPGGVFAFREVSYTPFLLLSAHLPPLVRVRFPPPRNLQTLRSEHRDPARSSPDLPGGWAARTDHAYGDSARE